MTPEERSRELRQEADRVLDLVRLQELCDPIGQLVPTGSYLLDLMMHPDIDLYLPLTSPDRLMRVGVELSKQTCVKKLRYLRGGPGELKEGFYLKPEIEYGNWGRLWKIDIWSLPKAVIEKMYAEMERLRSRMTPAHRELILETKHRLLTTEKRTPMFSGIFIYRAIIDHGMTAHEDIVEFLLGNGIVL